ncbi:MAG: glycosyltransferase family 2 protein [Planctomycetota bacterium]|nr:glycosyltransferase family 2 protein [Planctomycetota bacterium]
MSATGTWAVVVNWNGGEENLECIRSLLGQDLPPERLVFIDNASTDRSREAVEERFDDLRLIVNDENLGFGRGVNQGIELALGEGAERVMLLNNDAVLPAGTLARLEEALAEEGLGIVGPRILFKQEPDVVWAAGGRMTYRQNLTALIGHRKPDGPQYQTSFDVDYVTGCAMLVRREVFEEVGLFDSDYFAYHEDVEFCMKAREKGWRVRTIGEVSALHSAHVATGGGYNPHRKYMMGVNTIWFLRRHGTPARWLSFIVFDVLSLPFVWLTHAFRGEGSAVIAKARGMLDGLRGKRITEKTLRTL